MFKKIGAWLGGITLALLSFWGLSQKRRADKAEQTAKIEREKAERAEVNHALSSVAHETKDELLQKQEVHRSQEQTVQKELYTIEQKEHEHERKKAKDELVNSLVDSFNNRNK